MTEFKLPSDVRNITDENNFHILGFLDAELAEKAASVVNRTGNDDCEPDEIEAECILSTVVNCKDFKLLLTKVCYVSPEQWNN